MTQREADWFRDALETLTFEQWTLLWRWVTLRYWLECEREWQRHFAP